MLCTNLSVHFFVAIQLRTAQNVWPESRSLPEWSYFVASVSNSTECFHWARQGSWRLNTRRWTTLHTTGNNFSTDTGTTWQSSKVISEVGAKPWRARNIGFIACPNSSSLNNSIYGYENLGYLWLFEFSFMHFYQIFFQYDHFEKKALGNKRKFFLKNV